MNAVFDDWGALWAAGGLTLRQYRSWRPCYASAEACVRGEWERRPRAWSARAEDADGFLAYVDREALRARESLACSWTPDARLIESDALDWAGPVSTRSPFVMVAGGDPLRAPIAVVGTRRLPADEAEIVAGIVEGAIEAAGAVVSGGAFGVDALAHRAALRVGARVVIVVASGLSHAGPVEHRGDYREVLEAGGALVSERPPHRNARREWFLERNRMIAALSDATLVARAPDRSGAMATARFARQLGRPVYAIPGNPGVECAAGCLTLIRSGATLCAAASDIATSVQQRALVLPAGAPAAELRAVPELAPVPAEYRSLVEAIRAGCATQDSLGEKLGLCASSLSVLLTQAELQDVVAVDGSSVRLLRR